MNNSSLRHSSGNKLHCRQRVSSRDVADAPHIAAWLGKTSSNCNALGCGSRVSLQNKEIRSAETLMTRLWHALITVLVILGATSSLGVLAARALQALTSRSLQHFVSAGMLPRGL